MANNKELQAMLEQMQAEMATLRANLATVEKERDEAKQRSNRGGRGRDSLPDVLGHNATSVMRALVALGCTGAEMNKALAAGYSIYASPSGMNTQVSRVDKWLKATDKNAKEVKGFAPASLTREQVDELCDKAGIAKPTTLPDWCKQ